SIKEDSMPARVIKTGEPVRAARKPGGEQIKVKTDYLVEALLFIPLKLGGVTFGVLAATQREEGRRFSERDERLLGAIADFAAIAVQNARVYEAADRALSQRVVELAAINDLSMAVTQSLDLNEVYDILVDELSKHPLVHDVMLWLIKDNGQLDIYPDNEANQNKLKRTGDQYTKAVQEVVSSSAPSVSDFIDVDEEFTAVDGSSTSRIKARSLIALPLKAKKDVVGALALVAKRGSVRDDDLTRFQAFANPVATAIENARLYQQSEQSRAVITATASTLTQPLLILDDNGNVVIANKAAQELLDKHMSDLFNGLSAGVGRTTGIHLGEQIYLATSESTESVGTIVVMQDVTYEKQLEREQADIMRALSHDLKSPLTSIKGWAQLTQQVAKLEDKPEHYVNQIVYSADRMLSMINDLLNMAVNRDIPASALQPCSLDLPVRRAVSDVQGAALSKSITIDFSVTGTPFTIQGDENRLYHMALNLVENAIKYSPEKTEVAVELTFDKTSGITLAVSDQGPGIPEEDLLRIFERYIRGTNQTDIIGSGIGLSVVKAVAIAHGGSAEAMNLPGGGARFTVKIPATKTAV
nr:GAF domain-containing sensor histidine kinase [Anaerolineae bacterium]